MAIYNDHLLLDCYLAELIHQVSNYGVPIFLYDNSENDENKKIYQKYSKQYLHLFYVKNKENIGGVKNIINAMTKPDVDYVLTLTLSDNCFSGNSIKTILDILVEHEPDFLCLNKGMRVSNDINTKLYDDCNQVFDELAWHLTNISVLIWSKKVLDNITFERYEKSLFPHLGTFLVYISSNKFSLFWLNEQMWDKKFALPYQRQSTWRGNVLETWCEKWAGFIFSLPETYDLNKKFKVIKKHNKLSKLFSINSLLLMRMNNQISLKQVFSSNLNFVFSHNKIFLLAVSLIPVQVLGWAYPIFKRIKSTLV